MGGKVISSHDQHMAECLRLARKGLGAVSPNPLVGSLLVKNGGIIGRGYHKRFGGPHAEVNCIRTASESPESATLYVNLEPCSYYGKTPPCTDLIIASGIKRVAIGMKDPNPLVSGKGIAKLRRAGVEVITNVLEDDCRELNKVFCRHITTGRPYVHLKIAQTLDGKVSRDDGTRTIITGKEVQTLVHRWRAEYDAILVGAQTVILDDPELNVRLVKGRDPAIVVLDGHLNVTNHTQLFSSAAHRRILTITTQSSIEKKKGEVAALRKKGIEIYGLKGSKHNVDLRELLALLYEQSFGSLLVESGPDVSNQFLFAGLVDEMSLFIGPMVMGKGLAAFKNVNKETRLTPVRQFSCCAIGNDIWIHSLFYT